MEELLSFNYLQTRVLYILSILIKQCREHINTFSSYFTPTQYIYINVNIEK